MSVSIPSNIDESLQNLTGYIEAMKKKLEESIPVVQKLEKFLEELEELCTRYDASIQSEDDEGNPEDIVLVVEGCRFLLYTSTISGD